MAKYAVINLAAGIVVNSIVWDGSIESGWSPPDDCIAVESETAGIGWSYVDGEFIAPEPEPVPDPTPAEILAANTATRDYLLAQATLAIAPLQDAVDLDDATAADIALLKKLKQYRVAVNRVDLTTTSPVWPPIPA